VRAARERVKGVGNVLGGKSDAMNKTFDPYARKPHRRNEGPPGEWSQATRGKEASGKRREVSKKGA